LAAEDVRFARTIERIQRIVESELYKIGIIHLYAQGFKDAELINWSVKLTTPSTIYEQEKVNLWKEKVLLARDMSDGQMVSSDWIYKNVFNLEREEFEKERELVIEDTKRKFRIEQILQGMPDPAKFGWPQDQEQPPMEDMGGGMPPAGGAPAGAPMESEEPGRPEKGISYGQDSYPVGGRDALGFKERYHVIGDKQKREQPRKFPLSLESRELEALQRKLFNSKARARQTELPLFEGSGNGRHEDDSDRGTFMDENIALENVSDDE
jgi:hypothetical protein